MIVLVGSNTFKYDPFGRRIQKLFTQNSTTTATSYVYDGSDSIEEVDQNGNILARYSRTLNVDEPLAESRSGTTSYYEQDGLGSVTSMTNAAGALAQTYTLDSFGKQTASSGSLTNPFRYTGRELDSETGLYYYRARYYDPTIGRFISEDPLAINSDDLNLYRYVASSPIGQTDPFGRGKKWYDCGGGCGFRLERDEPKGLHVNWWCNGAKGCLLIPSLEPCEVGKSNVPPARILRCIRKKLNLPEPKPAVQKCPVQAPNQPNLFCAPGQGYDCVPRPGADPAHPFFPWLPPLAPGLPGTQTVPIPEPAW